MSSGVKSSKAITRRSRRFRLIFLRGNNHGAVPAVACNHDRLRKGDVLKAAEVLLQFCGGDFHHWSIPPIRKFRILTLIRNFFNRRQTFERFANGGETFRGRRQGARICRKSLLFADKFAVMPPWAASKSISRASVAAKLHWSADANTTGREKKGRAGSHNRWPAFSPWRAGNRGCAGWPERNAARAPRRECQRFSGLRPFWDCWS